MRELIDAFRALRHAPRALWLVIFAYSIDMMAYFGILPLMKAYLGQDIGIRPVFASWWVSGFTCALSGVMIFVGRPIDQKIGIRRGILLALSLAVVGRALYSSAPFGFGIPQLAVSLAIVALGEGIIQPVAYSGIKKYTDEKSGPMGYAILYAFFNLGAALIGPVSASVRTTYDVKHKAGESALSGFDAVNWVCFGITLALLAVFALTMTKKAEAAVVRTDDAPSPGSSPVKSRGPFGDPRFLFFIFALLPVRTLFAHQWLTMPEYVLRGYSEAVANRMEYLVDSINPTVIFFGVPLVTALTKRVHVLTMMIIGTAVSASSTFLLCFGEHTPLLILYFVIFSIGEALWSSRFYEYAAELAPPGRTAEYMGVASLPWFVAKMTTGLYSGFLLEAFVPKDGARSTATLWIIYGAIAITTPIVLVLGSRWLRAGMTKPPVKAPVEEAKAAA